MFVRAVILTESGFNPCSAAKVCSRECLGGAGREDDCTDRCFGAGFNGDSECYSNAYDEMDDPSGNCTANLASAPDLTLPDGSINPRPSWRWCALGLMQSLEPPYHFWPSEYLPAGVRNDYSDVFDRSGFDDNPRFRSRLIDAKGCNPLFNPFNPSDSICVGTLRLEQSIIDARRWISRHRSQLNWPETDLDKDNLFTVYVASHYYGGTWAQDTRRSDYVGCLRGTPNGDCWISGFVMSNTVTEEFCRTATGDYRCRDGHPLQDPPFECYGYTDIIRYINECEIPFTARGVDGGKRKTEAYLYLLNGCENSMCPDGRRLFRAMERSLPSSGTPYLPDSMATGTGGS
jgi:hypothetical protein